MATQQEVIKAFMKSLDTQTLKKKSNETTIAFTIRIIDEAIKACSNFTDTSSLRAKIIADYESCVAADPKNGWKKFLLEKCGINFDNTNTGAITGSDAGGSKVKIFGPAKKSKFIKKLNTVNTLTGSLQQQFTNNT